MGEEEAGCGGQTAEWQPSRFLIPLASIPESERLDPLTTIHAATPSFPVPSPACR